MNNLILSGGVDSWILYVFMGILLLGNIAFIVLFIISVARNNKLEDRIQSDLREYIGKTESDLNGRNPVDAQQKSDGQYKYKVVESPKKDGFYVIDKNSKEKLGFAKNKDEAQEIIKNLARNN